MGVTTRWLNTTRFCSSIAPSPCSLAFRERWMKPIISFRTTGAISSNARSFDRRMFACAVLTSCSAYSPKESAPEAIACLSAARSGLLQMSRCARSAVSAAMHRSTRMRMRSSLSPSEIVPDLTSVASFCW